MQGNEEETKLIYGGDMFGVFLMAWKGVRVFLFVFQKLRKNGKKKRGKKNGVWFSLFYSFARFVLVSSYFFFFLSWAAFGFGSFSSLFSSLFCHSTHCSSLFFFFFLRLIGLGI